MARFSEVLKNRNFLFLFIGQIISQMGDRLGQIALIAFVYSRSPQSTMGIAKVLIPTIIPVFVVGPIAGVYVDRWDRRRTMYISDLLRAVLLLIIPLFLFYSKSIAALYVIIFLVFCISRFFLPAKLSIIPEIVSSSELLIANSLTNITGMIATVLGYGLSGWLVESLGAQSGFYLDSLSFLISAFFIFLIVNKSKPSINLKEVGKEIVEVISKSVVQEIKEGMVYFVQKKEIRFAASILFILAASLGAISTVLIVFVQQHLGTVVKDLGFLIMFLGIGLFFGSLIYGRFGQKISHYKIIFTCLCASGIMLIVFAIGLSRYPYFPIAALLSLLFGLVSAPIIIAANTIIHAVSENGMLGKIFSSIEIVMHLGFMVFMLLSSFLAEKIPSTNVLISVGCLFSLLGIINSVIYRKKSWLN